jgi:hypothetical protein
MMMIITMMIVFAHCHLAYSVGIKKLKTNFIPNPLYASFLGFGACEEGGEVLQSLLELGPDPNVFIHILVLP